MYYGLYRRAFPRCFCADKLHWESYNYEKEDVVPEPRAGHCAAMVHNRMYIWSGRDGYKKPLETSDGRREDSQVAKTILSFFLLDKIGGNSPENGEQKWSVVFSPATHRFIAQNESVLQCYNVKQFFWFSFEGLLLGHVVFGDGKARCAGKGAAAAGVDQFAGCPLANGAYRYVHATHALRLSHDHHFLSHSFSGNLYVVMKKGNRTHHPVADNRQPMNKQSNTKGEGIKRHFDTIPWDCTIKVLFSS